MIAAYLSEILEDKNKGDHYEIKQEDFFDRCTSVYRFCHILFYGSYWIDFTSIA